MPQLDDPQEEQAAPGGFGAGGVGAPIPARTGLDRAFELLAAASAGDGLLTGALARVVAETSADLDARSELLGALVHTCLVAVGSLSELVGDSVETILPLLRATVAGQDADGEEGPAAR